MIVADTNTFLAVALNEPEKDRIIEVTIGHELIAPEVLPFEIGNALTAMLKRGTLSAEEVARTCKAALAIPVELRSIDMEAALCIAVEHGLYAYDAYFLSCCRRTGAPLLTLDRGMSHVAAMLGIHLLWERGQ